MDINTSSALDTFTALCSSVTAEYYAKHYKSLEPPKFWYEAGPKYVRIVRRDEGQTHGSVHCFVRLEDGAILYPAGWKKPFIARGGPHCAATVRGNIFAPDGGLSALTPFGIKAVR